MLLTVKVGKSLLEVAHQTRRHRGGFCGKYSYIENRHTVLIPTFVSKGDHRLQKESARANCFQMSQRNWKGSLVANGKRQNTGR